MKVRNNLFFILVVVFFIVSCNGEKIQELTNINTELHNELSRVKQSLDEKIDQYNNLSNDSRIEKSQLESEISSLSDKFDSLQREMKVLRESSINPDDDSYLNSVIQERDRFQELLTKEHERNATLETSIQILKDRFDTDSRKYIATISTALFQVYDDLIEINSQSLTMDRDLSEASQGVRRINLVSAIQQNMEIVKEKLNRAKQTLVNAQQEIPDSLDYIKQTLTIAENKISEKENLLSQYEIRIEDYRREIEEAYKGYFLIKSKNELKRKGIITGGIFGFGKQRYNAENISVDECDIVDKRGFLLHIIHSTNTKAKIVSTHNISSYVLKNQSDGIDVLTIKNPKEFWRSSNMLVVALE